MPATLKKSFPRAVEAPTEADIVARNAREVAQARLDWAVRPAKTLNLRVKWQRFYSRARWDWDALKVVKAEVEENTRRLRAKVGTPEPWVSGETWTMAAERLEEGEAELWAILFRFRMLARERSNDG